MATNHTSGLVLLSRTLADHFTTPTASTFATSRSGSHDYACDEGDILDDLVGPTPSRPRLRGPTIHDEDDEDDVSTCSSATACRDNDRSSVGSRGRSRYSDTTSITSISERSSIEPPKVIAGGQASNAGGGGRNGRRRRRRNNRAQSSVAESEAASETAYETSSVADSVLPRTRKSRNNKARKAKPTAVKTNGSNGGNGSSRAAKGAAKAGRSSSPAPLVRRSRNPTKGSFSREAATTRDLSNGSKPRRSRHPRLIIGLDLDAELELKSKVQGDICLTLVMEEEAKRAPRQSPELRLKKTDGGRLVAVEDGDSMSEYTSEEDEDEDDDEDVEEDEDEDEDDDEHNGGQGANNKLNGSIKQVNMKRTEKKKNAEKQSKESTQEPKPAASAPDDDEKQTGHGRKGRREICHMRIGRFNLTRRWWMDGFELVGRVPPPLIVLVVSTLPVVGFAAGWAASAQWSAGMACV